MIKGQSIEFTTGIELYGFKPGDQGKFIEPHLHYDGEETGMAWVARGQSRVMVPVAAIRPSVELNNRY